MNLLELHDSRVTLRSAQRVLAASPGFANVAGAEPLFGEAARQVARLHPRQNFHQFWQQLSLDPLAIKTKTFRHHADLAYRHLQLLTQEQELGAGVLVATPASYTRTQLSVLLGILKPFPFRTLALIDHGLLLAAASEVPDCIVLDLQLHQAVLSCYREVDGSLQREKLSQIPAAGSLALLDAWSSVVSDAFLQQSRFDPTHSAETEQYIANQLPVWLAASARSGELQLEINLKGSTFQARVTHDMFCERSKTLFARIARELAALRTADSGLFTQAGNLALPGLTAAFPGIQGLDEHAGLLAAERHRELLLKPADSPAFLSRLPLAKQPAATAGAAPARQPTHVLLDHQAYTLPLGRTLAGESAGQSDLARVLGLPGWHGSLVLQRGPRGVLLERVAGEVLCNEDPATAGRWLKPGDCLRAGTHQLLLISVE